MTQENNLLRTAELCRQLANTPTSGTQSVDRLLRAVAKRLEREAKEIREGGQAWIVTVMTTSRAADLRRTAELYRTMTGFPTVCGHNDNRLLLELAGRLEREANQLDAKVRQSND